MHHNASLRTKKKQTTRCLNVFEKFFAAAVFIIVNVYLYFRFSYTPLTKRRPSTSYANRQAFSPPPRIHSATSRITMTTPRTNVSMAGFYDWSTEEFDDVTMPSVYQKIAMHQKAKYNKGNKAWCTDGVHLNPGRMFVRDKADLTKGEREIIAGIYKNRSEMYNGTRPGYITQVKSHKDAWLVGRQMQRKGNSNNSNVSECEKCSLKLPEPLSDRSDLTREQSDCVNYTCDKCRECMMPTHMTKVANNWIDKTIPVSGRKAPPTSPDTSPKTARKSPPKSRAHEGAVYIESGKTFYDSSEGSKKKKVYVDVFLPKFPTPSLVEEPTNLDELDAEFAKSRQVNESPRLCKIAEQSTEHSDEGYSSHEKPSSVRVRPALKTAKICATSVNDVGD